jgi:hypothetical protein
MTSGTVATGSAQEKVRGLSISRRGYSTRRDRRAPREITPTTVRRHISDLVDKLGLRDRSALTTRT